MNGLPEDPGHCPVTEMQIKGRGGSEGISFPFFKNPHPWDTLVLVVLAEDRGGDQLSGVPLAAA